MHAMHFILNAYQLTFQMQCNTIINVYAHFLTVQAWYGYRNTSWSDCVGDWVGDWVGDLYLLLPLLLLLTVLFILQS